MLHDTGHLLANLLIEIRVEIIRCKDYLFQYRKVLHHDTVLLLLTTFFFSLDDLLYSFVMSICYLLRILRQHACEKIRIVGIDDGEFLGLATKELTVKPCNLGSQFFDTGLKRFVLLSQFLDGLSLGCIYLLQRLQHHLHL